jgi:YfiH family protein
MSNIRWAISDKANGNLAFHSGEQCSIVENRRRFLGDSNLSIERLVVMNQVHGSTILHAKENDAGRGALSVYSAVQNTDALMTNEFDLVLMAMGADCGLVGLIDDDHHAIAVVHSGWKGTLQGIVPKTIQSMTEVFGSDPSKMRVILSPMALSCCYEIKEDVSAQFISSGLGEWVLSDQGTLYLDNQNAIFRQLTLGGVLSHSIEVSEKCTICNEKYPSFRREGPVSSRFGLILWVPA